MLVFFQNSNYLSTLIYRSAGQEQITVKEESACFAKELAKNTGFSHKPFKRVKQSGLQGSIVSQSSPYGSRSFWGLWSLCLRKICRAVPVPASPDWWFLSSPRPALILRLHPHLKVFICECTSFSCFLLWSFYCISSSLGTAELGSNSAESLPSTVAEPFIRHLPAMVWFYFDSVSCKADALTHSEWYFSRNKKKKIKKHCEINLFFFFFCCFLFFVFFPSQWKFGFSSIKKPNQQNNPLISPSLKMLIWLHSRK